MYNHIFNDDWKRFQKLVLVAFFGLIFSFSGLDLANSQSSTFVEDENFIAQMTSAHEKPDARLLSIEFSNNTIQEALEILANKINVGFSYSPEIIPDKRINLSMMEVPPHKIIYKLLEGTNLEPVLPPSKDVIVIRQKENKTDTDFFQESVRGTVVDAVTGEALPGVSIVVLGTDQGTATNLNGEFELMVPTLNETLVFTYIGYQRLEVPLDERDELDISLEPEVIAGDEVVVVGYGEQRRRDITSSISSINAEDIANEPVQQVAQSLQGKVSGVQISQNSGNPGSEFMMRIRGVGSTNDRSTEPLYVVDGNPMANPSDISPSQVQNIQVLKSASATAIYGARGANGVVLITTKGGRSGDLQFDLDMYNGVQYGRKVPLTNAQQYATLYNEAVTNAGQAPIFPNPNFGEGTDWQDVAYRPAVTQNINMSISGGNEYSTYFVSGQYENQEGVVRATEFERFNIRLNSRHDITSFITLGENIGFSRSFSRGMETYSTGGFFNRGIARDPTIPVKNPDGSWGQLPRGNNLEAQFQRDEDQDDGTERPVLTGSAFIDIKPLNSLVIRSQYNFIYGSSRTSSFTPTYFISTTDQNELSSISQSETNWNNWNLENTVNYQEQFGRHDFETLVGITAQKSFSENWSASANNLPANATQFKGLRYLGLAETGQDVGGSGGGFAMLSYLGRINYDFDDKYLATVNYRIDGSSKFGENNRYGYFPSFSLGWRLSNENFMQDMDFINNLLIRAGWGQIGNQNSLPNYAYTSSVSRGMNYTFNDNWIPGQAPEGSGNPDLKWESIQETNVGLSFTGFQNSVTVEVDYYNKVTTDMLLQVPVVAYSGIVDPAFRNAGEILNRGIELAVGYQRTTPGEFYYNLNANMSYNKNELTELTAQTSTILGGWISFIGDNYTTRASVGNPLGVFYGYEADGLFQTQSEVDNHATQPNAAPGDIRFKDLNGDGVINDEDQAIIGNPWPDYTFGLNASFAYKNFDMNLGFSGQLGNDIFAAWKWTWYGGNWFNYHENALDRWTGEGTSNEIPRLHINDPNNNLRNSSWYVEDGSYLRLNNWQLGYTIPQSLVNIRELRIYATATNILTITGYSGQDPELGTSSNVAFDAPFMVGIDSGHYAVPRTFTIGVNIGL